METVRKTYQEKLRPTPAQERELERILWRCRTLYNTALEQRITLWKQRGVSVTRYQQEAELKTLRADLPEYGALHSHVLQDVLARLDKTYQAFFRRAANGEKPGFPRFQGRGRYHSFTYKEYGNGARLDNGSLVLSKIGRMAVRWSRSIEGTIKTVTISKEVDGWYISFSCAEVPTEPLPETGRETGIDVGLKVFLITADGDVVDNPRHYRTAEKALKKAQKRVSRRKKGSKRRAKAAHQYGKKHQHVRRQRCDFHHKTALMLVRQYDTIYVEAIQPANLSRRPASIPDGNGQNGGYEHNGPAAKRVSTKAFTTPDGATSCPSSLSRQHAPASEWKRSIQRTRPRTVQVVARGSKRVCPCARMSVLPVDSSLIGMRTRPETFYGADSAFGESQGCLRR